MRLRIKVLMVVTLFSLITGCSMNYNPQRPALTDGNIDLTRWKKADENVRLDGKWEFHWNQLLTYNDLIHNGSGIHAPVPDTWNNYSINGIKLPGQGYATYRLHVVSHLPQNTLLGLYADSFSSAYKLFINEELVAWSGQVGQNAGAEIGRYKPQPVFFNIPDAEFDIIIQVSNFQHSRGGFWHSLLIGSPEGILKYHNTLLSKEVFIFGVLTIVSLFYFFNYLFMKDIKVSLYFFLLCFFSALTIDLTGGFFLCRLLPSLPFNWVIFILYSANGWTLFFLLLFIHEIYRCRFSALAKNAYLGLMAIMQLIFCFTPGPFYTRLDNTINTLGAFVIFSTIISILWGIRQGYKNGWLYLTGMLVVGGAYLNDLLIKTNIMTTDCGEIMYTGAFIYIFLHMVIQAKNIKDFHENKIKAELCFLQAQIKPHFIFNTINAIISVSRYDMEKARDLLIKFTAYLRKSIDLEGITDIVSLRNEIELAESYLAIEKARFEERLEASFEINADLETKVPILILQPVIENAVYHGILPKKEGGRIQISVKAEGKVLRFKVGDNGVGMNTEQNFRKDGVGLANIEARLRKHYGSSLQIKSSPLIGTEVTWDIPLKKGANRH